MFGSLRVRWPRQCAWMIIAASSSESVAERGRRGRGLQWIKDNVLIQFRQSTVKMRQLFKGTEELYIIIHQIHNNVEFEELCCSTHTYPQVRVLYIPTELLSWLKLMH